MGQVLSRYSRRRGEGLTEEKDTPDLIEAQADIDQRNDTTYEISTNTEIEEDPTDEKPTEPYLDHPFLTDKSSIESMKNSLTMIIMRGMPGSGKSTIVRKLKELYPEVKFISSFF